MVGFLGERMATRIALICIISLLALQLSSCISLIGGAFDWQPQEYEDKLSPEAKKLIENAYKDIQSEQLYDYHTHILGVGTQQTKSFVNPHMLTWRHPISRIKFLVYLSGSGVDDMKNVDQQYVDRLLDLIENSPVPGKFAILAFDKFYDEKGKADLKKRSFIFPTNEIGAAAGIRGKGLSIPAVEVFVAVSRGVNIAGDASAKTGIAAAAGHQIGADEAIALEDNILTAIEVHPARASVVEDIALYLGSDHLVEVERAVGSVHVTIGDADVGAGQPNSVARSEDIGAFVYLVFF